MLRQELKDIMNIIKTLVLGGVTVALLLALPAGARETDDGYVIDEVLLTAEKRDSSSQDTPLPVSVRRTI
jgi:hypothetical protein